MPPVSPVLNSSTPEISPSSSQEGNVPVNKVPIPEPNAPGTHIAYGYDFTRS